MLLIASHTLQKVLKDMRLSLLLAVILSTLGISGALSSEEMLREREQASRRSLQAQRVSDLDRALVVKPWNPLAFAHQGLEREMPQHLVVSPYLTDYPRQDVSNRELSPSSHPLDWTFVLKYVISIVCLLISFDLVCGESDRGTLRVLITMGASRWEYFAGSYLGSLMAVLSTALLGFLLSLIIVVIRTSAHFGSATLASLALMVIAALIVCVFFVGLGLLASSLTTRPASALLLSLAFWIGFVFLVPNLAKLAADQIEPIPSAQAWETELKNAQSRFLARLSPLSGADIQRVTSRSELSDAQKHREVERLQQEIDSQDEIARRLFAEDIVNLRQRFLQALWSQAEWADKLSLLSPISAYEQLADALTSTGLRGQRRFFQLAERYRQILEEYALPLRQQKRDEAVSLGGSITSGDFAIKNVQRISYAKVKFDRSGYPRPYFPSLRATEVIQSAGLPISLFLASIVWVWSLGLIAFRRYPI